MKANLSNLVFTGFMGTGKSSIGQLSASALSFDFIDIDKEIENRENMLISEIFATFGEAYFRRLESKLIEEISLKTKTVISTGGGVVLNPENISNLRKNGIVILLKAEPEIIYRNVAKDKNRPLLNCENPMARIIELLEARKSYYENNDFEIDVSKLTIQEAALRAIQLFNNKCSS
ncbi:MAG: shikimate kinase [Ignavibacteriales bacterium]